MARLLVGPQPAEHIGHLGPELDLGGIAAAVLLDQLLDDVAGLLRCDVLVLNGDHEIGVQITSGAQAVVAEVGEVPAQRAIGKDVAGAVLVPIGGRADSRGQPPPVVGVGDDVTVAPILVDGQEEDHGPRGAVVLQAVVCRQVDLGLEEGAAAAGGLDQVVEEGAVQVVAARALSPVVAAAIVEGTILDDLLGQTEGAAVRLMLQHDPSLAGVVEGGAAGEVLECFLHGCAPFILGDRPFGLACISLRVSSARSRLSQCGQV